MGTASSPSRNARRCSPSRKPSRRRSRPACYSSETPRRCSCSRRRKALRKALQEARARSSTTACTFSLRSKRNGRNARADPGRRGGTPPPRRRRSCAGAPPRRRARTCTTTRPRVPCAGRRGRGGTGARPEILRGEEGDKAGVGERDGHHGRANLVRERLVRAHVEAPERGRVHAAELARGDGLDGRREEKERRLGDEERRVCGGEFRIGRPRQVFGDEVVQAGWEREAGSA